KNSSMSRTDNLYPLVLIHVMFAHEVPNLSVEHRMRLAAIRDAQIDPNRITSCTKYANPVFRLDSSNLRMNPSMSRSMRASWSYEKTDANPTSLYFIPLCQEALRLRAPWHQVTGRC